MRAPLLLLLLALLWPAHAGPQERTTSHAAEGPTLRSSLLQNHFYYQGELPLCAFFTEKAILEAYLGRVLPTEDLFVWYAATGTFDVQAMGVPAGRVGDALKVKGFTVQRGAQTKETLRTALTKGYAVMAVINPVYYWNPDDPMVDFWVDLQRRRGIPLASHLVWVTDASQQGVVLNDSALKNGAALQVDWSVFSRSWAESGYQAIVVPRVLPPLDPDRDGVPLVDADGDGDASQVSGGADCDDSRAAVNPSADEVPYNGLDDDCTDGDLVDADGDGYKASQARGNDCDDNKPEVHPGAEDFCYDGVDSDCIPDDYDRDCDGDGALLPPAGNDCSDEDPSIRPNAREVCDGVDNDCDGDIDSSDTNVVADTIFFADEDGDGFGADASSLGGCKEYPPAGFASIGGDCNDEDSSIRPDATEICDGIDNDCDGKVDDADDSRNTDHLCYRDSDGDGRGRHDNSKPACVCTSGWAERGFDCDDSDDSRAMFCD